MDTRDDLTAATGPEESLRLEEKEKAIMSGTGDSPVVVGVDGSEFAVHAVRWGAFEAERRRQPLRLVHFYGLPPLTVSLGKLRETLDAEGHASLAEAKDAVLRDRPDLTVQTVLREGMPVPALLEESGRATMIVLGARGLGGFTGLAAGSTAVALAEHGRCPTVVVRGREPGGPPPSGGPVVVGTDGSAGSDAAVAFAFEEAAMRGTHLIAVHTWSEVLVADGSLRAHPFDLDPGRVEEAEQEVLARQIEAWQEKYPGIEVRRVVTRGRPVRELLVQGEQAQLIVVGSRGRGGFDGMLLGSTSQALVAHSTCPVAVIRAPGR